VSSQLITPRGEAAIWARLIESQPEELTPEAAKYLLGLGFTENDQARLQELADRSQDGTLSEDEGREFDSYLHIGNLLSVMQSKARLVLGAEDLPSLIRECEFKSAGLATSGQPLRVLLSSGRVLSAHVSRRSRHSTAARGFCGIEQFGIGLFALQSAQRTQSGWS
jgi:hypothetical protein